MWTAAVVTLSPACGVPYPHEVEAAATLPPGSPVALQRAGATTISLLNPLFTHLKEAVFAFHTAAKLLRDF